MVGILGGMGPAATADFYVKLIRATPASSDQEHLRVIIWADPSTPDRAAALLEGGPDPTPWLVHGARTLAAAGADLLAVPCNTAHAFLDAVVEQVGVPVVHIIEETGDWLAGKADPPSTVGLLATTGTVSTGLYDAWLGRSGITVLAPDRASQETEVMPAIRAIKGSAVPRGGLVRAARRLVDRGAEAIIAGCTEVPLGLDPAQIPVPLVDPTQILAEAVVARALHPARPRRYAVS